jgi:hypothetical protein
MQEVMEKTMPKAKFALPNGTMVHIEGSVEELEQMLQKYSSDSPKRHSGKNPTKSGSRTKNQKHASENLNGKSDQEEIDLTSVIQHVRDSESSDLITSRVLDHPNMLNRVLLPIYVAQVGLHQNMGMTSGEISKILRDLGTPISIPNVSTTLSRTARNYVMGDKVRKKGVPVRYQLTRRGVQYFEELLNE